MCGIVAVVRRVRPQREPRNEPVAGLEGVLGRLVEPAVGKDPAPSLPGVAGRGGAHPQARAVGRKLPVPYIGQPLDAVELNIECTGIPSLLQQGRELVRRMGAAHEHVVDEADWREVDRWNRFGGMPEVHVPEDTHDTIAPIVAALRGEETALGTVEDAWINLAVCHAFYEAAEKGTVVTPPSLP